MVLDFPQDYVFSMHYDHLLLKQKLLADLAFAAAAAAE